jgi:hypothetical protein
MSYSNLQATTQISWSLIGIDYELIVVITSSLLLESYSDKLEPQSLVGYEIVKGKYTNCASGVLPIPSASRELGFFSHLQALKESQGIRCTRNRKALHTLTCLAISTISRSI